MAQIWLAKSIKIVTLHVKIHKQTINCTRLYMASKVNVKVKGKLQMQHYKSGPSCSKLTTSLVNVSLKFQTLILQIHCYFFVEKIMQRILTFYQQKITVYLLI